MTPKDDTYKCDMCGDTFEKGWSDEEAEEEAADIFGVEGAASNSDMSVVCEDCFRKVMGESND